MKGAYQMDEHDPRFNPEDQTSTIDFLSAVARGVLFAAAIAMVVAIILRALGYGQL
jgi:hypothetical protein